MSPDSPVSLLLIDQPRKLEVQQLLICCEQLVSRTGIDELQPINLNDVLIFLSLDDRIPDLICLHPHRPLPGLCLLLQDFWNLFELPSQTLIVALSQREALIRILLLYGRGMDLIGKP